MDQAMTLLPLCLLSLFGAFLSAYHHGTISVIFSHFAADCSLSERVRRLPSDCICSREGKVGTLCHQSKHLQSPKVHPEMEVFARSSEIVCPTYRFPLTFGSPRSEPQTDMAGKGPVWSSG